ncbi:hypothetical protein APHAL10511_006629 [Amanita phalloides]|nr:hypothetical protein APHAL10511_006629 [Amanita phalloides]
MEFHSLACPLPHIPDDLTIPQFIFEYVSPNRPARAPSIPWLIDNGTGRQVFGHELRKRTFALANALKIMYGIGEDDVALIFGRNHVDYPVATWAVHMLGGIISGANPGFTVDELLYQINETNARVLFVFPDCLEVARKAAHEAGMAPERLILFNTISQASADYTTVDDLVHLGLKAKHSFVERKLKQGEARTKLAYFNFSSGTTGRPKAVSIAHYAVITNVIQMAAHNRVNDDDLPWEDSRFRPGGVAIGVLPLYHIYGLVLNLHFILFAAMTYVVVSKFNYVEMLESVMRYHISHLMLVPPQITLLCKHPATPRYDLRRHVRFIMSGAAPLTSEINQELYRMFPDAHIGQAYGMTETCTAVTMFSITRKRGVPGSSGILMPGIAAKVVKSDGTLAGYGEEGELVIKSPSVALGYSNNKQATKETFIDGWVKTGDKVKIYQDGEVFVIDRIKEIMKVKGFQVAPAELEGCLLEHPDVAVACVVGVPDDYSGEVPFAFVTLRASAAECVARDPSAARVIKQSIIKHVADNKVSYKHLSGGVELVQSIPTSPSGKLLRRLMREKAKTVKKRAIAKL